ncbi:MAG: sugar phosphate nucleotidyltransferase [candidate division Zixibacteria bacterium]|nr:sugar phosphate nucleotidyltransferase [candidate division Zixibacteria bacterium]
MHQNIETYKMDCVILAGGKGKRLLPYTAEIPKPLVKIGDTPIIELLIKSLIKCNITSFTIAVNHQAEQIEEILGDGSQWSVSISYSHEPFELSTVAPLKLISNLPDNFLVVNSDIITDLKFDLLYDYHIQHDSLLTIAVCKREHKVNYGVIECDKNNNIVNFSEKPNFPYQVSMGVYVFSKELLEFVPDNTKFGFDDLMYMLLEKDIKIKTFEHDKFWLDIGRPTDYEKALQQFDIIKKIIS